MIFRYAPFDPEISPLIASASIYRDKEGRHPEVGSSFWPCQVKGKGEPLSDGEWELSVEDPFLYEKIICQISTIEMYKDSIYIVEQAVKPVLLLPAHGTGMEISDHE